MAVVAAGIILRPHRAASHVHAGTTTRSAGPSCRVSPFLTVATVMTDEGDFAHLDGVIQGGECDELIDYNEIVVAVEKLI